MHVGRAAVLWPAPVRSPVEYHLHVVSIPTEIP
jgi:hypothetical protein